ncbi:hypothetical protein B0A52_09464 [Exophiala mesophila]|uniref:RING-CH-type domain-containing protein n=1 Tax=Exophiala mesophila TaxID=212818 RepID=A0A438MSH1_EXOME|nr:hypothetical protein B0A52_09464 [Exophiala mesophila]
MNSDTSDTAGLDQTNVDPPQEDAAPPDVPTRPTALSRTSTFGKKCWICMSDASEDDPNNPPIWRSPCSCSLTAHEDCLLDWVTNLEDPKTTRRKGQPQILCPQCRSEIKISRPRSYVVDIYRALDRAVARAVLPAIGLSLSGTFMVGLWLHGFCSVYWVFGQQEAKRILDMSIPRLGWLSAYPLIPINLIFSRTSYADFVLPSGTLFLLSTQITDKFEFDTVVWPPLPSTVFACLPAVRNIYNWCYHQAFCELNKKWIAEVQPRGGEVPEDQGQNIADLANAQAPDGVVLEINFGAAEDEEEIPELADQPQGPMPGQFDDDQGGEENAGEQREDNEPAAAAGNAGNEANQQQNGHVHRLLGDRGDFIVEGTSSSGQSIFGALAFPAVAAGMGELLNLVLPSSWLGTTKAIRGRPGLLQTKWGRSVIGGALFVVLKDALVLYCRWRLAQSHQHRRIMDYDRKTKKYTV